MSRVSNYIKRPGVIPTLLVSICYAVFYDFIYKNYLVANFGYYGETYSDMSSIRYSLYVILCVMPMFFYRGMSSLAAAVSIFVYTLIYVPFIDTLFVGGYNSSIVTPYIVVFFISMCAFFISDHKYPFKKLLAHKGGVSFAKFELITLLCVIYILAMNGSSWRFVNFLAVDNNLYELRAANNMDTISAYLMGWLKHVFLPLLMVSYLVEKKYIKYGMTFMAFLLLFMLDKQKITFFVPFVITLMYFAYARFPSFFKLHFHTIVISALIIIPLLLYLKLDSPGVFAISVIFIMRTQCIEGLLINFYLNFFEVGNHPYTYYTHINIINKLTGLYPYDDSIGYVVMDGDSNANGNFWLMDGVAAAGFIGCIISSVIFCIVKNMLNTSSHGLNIYLCIVVLMFELSAITNTSIFTSLLTGGVLILFIVFKYVDFPALKEKMIYE